ncbi:hypothetical protein PsYK624_024910 [Phanerochaete sordida]|uniref:F-box domain-containing protein n=1 Tax=Phanerochaete sordida TaxID=48140 RepID=A0A9P3L8S1_9APHY|nr:hypothetical protein PsYK624_024910 [Phanerochaete sordida]
MLYPASVVASVCSRWRIVAVDHGKLWSCINLSCSSALLACLLGRAAGHSLTVEWDVTEDRLQRNLKFLEDNIHRIKHLTFSLDTAFLTHLFAVLGAHAPVLERCEIRGDNCHFVTLAGMQGPLFGAHTPRLRHLEVDAITSPWTPAFLNANLTTLILSHQRVFAADSVGICQILEMSPHLKVLDLSVTCLDPDVDPNALHPVAREPRLQLDKLRTLKLHLPSSLICHIVSFIYAPSLCYVQLDMGEIESDPFEIVERLCRPNMLPPLPLIKLWHLSIGASTQRFSTESPQINIEGFAFGRRVLSLKWSRRRDSPRDRDAQTVRSIVEILRLETDPSPHAFTLGLKSTFLADNHPCDVLLSLPPVRYVEATDAAAEILARTVCAASSSPAVAAALREVEEIDLEKCELKASTMLGFLAWFDERCQDPGNKLRIATVANAIVRAKSEDAARSVKRRVQSLLERSVELGWDHVRFKHPRH